MHIADIVDLARKWEKTRMEYIEARLQTTVDKLTEAQLQYEQLHWNEAWIKYYASDNSKMIEANHDLACVAAVVRDHHANFLLSEAILIVEIFEPMYQGVLFWKFKDEMRRWKNRLSPDDIKRIWTTHTEAIFDTLRRKPAFAGKLPPKTKWVRWTVCQVQ